MSKWKPGDVLTLPTEELIKFRYIAPRYLYTLMCGEGNECISVKDVWSKKELIPHLVYKDSIYDLYSEVLSE